MADSVGNVYSTALFELCSEENLLPTVYKELTGVEEILMNDEHKDYLELLFSPLVSNEEKKTSLKSVFGNEISQLSLDFLCLVTEKGRIKYLPEIMASFKDKYNVKMNILEVTAVTSQPLSAALREKLVKKLESVSDKHIVLNEKTDKSILGGIKLRYGNTEIDSSVKSKLDELRNRIDNVIA